MKTPKEYKRRIKALGFKSGAAWANWVGVTVKTHQRHILPSYHKNAARIPQTLWNILDWLESGKLENPNDAAADGVSSRFCECEAHIRKVLSDPTGLYCGACGADV